MFAQELGIDLGTANTVVAAKRRGIIAREPSVVAIHRHTRAVVAVGAEAHRMIGRTPETIISARPIQGGAVSDLDHSSALLKHVLRGIARSRWLRPRLVLPVQTGATDVDRRALAEAAIQAGAGEVLLVEEAVAAGLGAGLPVEKPVGSLLVDLGSGTTDIAVLSLGSVVVSTSCPIAGFHFDEMIARHMKREHNLLVGSPTAERIKVECGAALPGRRGSTTVVGRLVTTGNPAATEVSSDEIFSALGDALARIDASLISTLEKTPPELLADVSRNGVTLTGGSALLPGMAERLSTLTGLPVRMADSPLESVALGTEQILENPKRVRLSRVK